MAANKRDTTCLINIAHVSQRNFIIGLHQLLNANYYVGTIYPFHGTKLPSDRLPAYPLRNAPAQVANIPGRYALMANKNRCRSSIYTYTSWKTGQGNYGLCNDRFR